MRRRAGPRARMSPVRRARVPPGVQDVLDEEDAPPRDLAEPFEAHLGRAARRGPGAVARGEDEAEAGLPVQRPEEVHREEGGPLQDDDGVDGPGEEARVDLLRERADALPDLIGGEEDLAGRGGIGRGALSAHAPARPAASAWAAR